MIHVFKVGRRWSRDVICWMPDKGYGRADHKYSAETCGWPEDGNTSCLFCCTCCHAHIYNPEQGVCGFCGQKFELGTRVGVIDRFYGVRPGYTRQPAL